MPLFRTNVLRSGVRCLQTSRIVQSAATSTSTSTGFNDPTKKHTVPVTVDRELPDPFANQKKNRKYFVSYAIGITLACAIIFNYEKTRSPITNSTLYFLRRSALAKEHLGEGIDFRSSWPWISGPLNTVKGDIDISFVVQGSKSKGVLKLKASRDTKLHPFEVHHFILEVTDSNGQAVEYDLTKDPAVEFDI